MQFMDSHGGVHIHAGAAVKELTLQVKEKKNHM